MQSLSLEQLEALLEFTNLADLEGWLASQE
ncbi:MAG: hypothetical protein AAGG02_16320 [Cyanobacteria bacterium P01_H01_bin.15]